jgi:hypothetical protein
MLKRSSIALAAVALAWVTGPATAQPPASAPQAAPAPLPAHQYANPVPGGYLAAPGCGGCAVDCCDKGGGFYGSIGVLYLRNGFDNNPAYARFDRTVDVDNGVVLSRFTTMQDFDDSWELAPRLEIGWSNGNGGGVRGRFFHYHTSDEIVTGDAIDPPFGTTGIVLLSGITTATPNGLLFGSAGTELDPSILVFENRLRLQTIDVEGFWSSKCGCTDLTWSLGVRYMQISQEYNAAEAIIALPPTADFSPGSPINQTLRSGHNLNGLGPILGIEGRRAVSENCKLYALGRVGLLYMTGGQDAFYLANFNPEFQIEPVFQEAHVERNRLVTTTEVELGAEYSRELSRGELFFRGGLVGQCYFGVGNSSRSLLGGEGDESKNNNLGLFGLNLTVGIRY